jgi:hypothetical protein
LLGPVWELGEYDTTYHSCNQRCFYILHIYSRKSNQHHPLYTRNVFSMLDGITNIANRKGQLVNQEAFAILTWKHSQYFFRQLDFLQLHPLLCLAEAGVLLVSSCMNKNWVHVVRRQNTSWPFEWHHNLEHAILFMNFCKALHHCGFLTHKWNNALAKLSIRCDHYDVSKIYHLITM